MQSLLAGLGDHGAHRLTYVENFFDGETPEVDWSRQALGREAGRRRTGFARNFLTADDEQNAVRGARHVGLDPYQSRVRLNAADYNQMHGILGEVGTILDASGYETLRVFAGYAAPDVRRSIRERACV